MAITLTVAKDDVEVFTLTTDDQGNLLSHSDGDGDLSGFSGTFAIGGPHVAFTRPLGTDVTNVLTVRTPGPVTSQVGAEGSKPAPAPAPVGKASATYYWPDGGGTDGGGEAGEGGD